MHRALTLAFLELRSAWRRPSVWMLIAILLSLNWGFSAGSVTIGAGSRVAGGDRAFLNSEFNLAFMDMLVFALFWVFFVCTAFGNATSEDDSLRVVPIVGSTGLTPREYVAGRWLGIAGTYMAILAVNLVLQVAFFQLYPVDEPEKVRGAFDLMNYVRPMALFVALPVLSLGAISFAIGALTRQAVQIGRASETQVEIVEGLTEGQRVLLRKPRPGEVVETPATSTPTTQAGAETVAN